jgi:hypothetical protein
VDPGFWSGYGSIELARIRILISDKEGKKAQKKKNISFLEDLDFLPGVIVNN